MPKLESGSHVSSGDYLSKCSYTKRLFLLIDILLVSLLTFLMGIVFSVTFDQEIFDQLNRKKSNTEVFFQILGDTSITIAAIYLILYLTPKIPCLVPNPPPEHISFRVRGSDVLIAFSIISCQLGYLDKLRYLYNELKDDEEALTEDVIGNFEICQKGETPLPGTFRCAI
jgi:hypothetical protein